MLIILEGVDAAGKSDLAAELARKLGPERTTTRHFGKADQHPLAFYELALDRYRPGGGRHFICDRFHISELVYRATKNEPDRLTAAARWHIEHFLEARGALLVHVVAAKDDIAARHDARGESFDDAQLDREFAHFVHAIGKSRLHHVNLTDADEILSIGRYLETPARALADFPSYVGPLEPEVLFVVEEQPNGDWPSHVASLVPYPGTAADVFITRNVLPSSSPVGVVAAYHRRYAPVDLKGLRRQLGDPTVVAFGRLAAHHCDVLQVPYVRAGSVL